MHSIRAFIGKDKIISRLVNNWILGEKIQLEQGFCMVFLTDDLFDDITELINKEYESMINGVFTFFTPSIIKFMEQESKNGELAYIETDYFGGVGKQSGVLFVNGTATITPKQTETLWDGKNNCYYQIPEGIGIINVILEEMGAYRNNTQDEFASIGLINYRRMD